MARFRRRADMKWIIVSVLIIALIAAVAVAFVKINNQETTKSVSATAYAIGTLDDKGVYAESTKCIYMKKSVSAEGLKCELADDAKIQYKLFYYSEDTDGKEVFLSASEWLTADFNETIPEGAANVKVVIQPTEDDEVSLLEIIKYANQLNVTYNK